MSEGDGRLKLSPGIITVIVLLVLQLLALAYGYGMLTQQVSFNREIIKEYQSSQVNLSDKLDNVISRLTAVETILLDR